MPDIITGTVGNLGGWLPVGIGLGIIYLVVSLIIGVIIDGGLHLKGDKRYTVPFTLAFIAIVAIPFALGLGIKKVASQIGSVGSWFNKPVG